MELKEYLKTINMTLKHFSILVGVCPHYLTGIAKGRITPGENVARAIERATNGHVKYAYTAKIDRRIQKLEQQLEMMKRAREIYWDP